MCRVNFFKLKGQTTYQAIVIKMKENLSFISVQIEKMC